MGLTGASIKQKMEERPGRKYYLWMKKRLGLM
jgi:hypothetical protein